MLMNRLAFITAALTVLGAFELHAAIPAGGFAGHWKVNFAKSIFPGPPPQVDMCTIDGDGTVTVHEVSADGKSISWSYTPVSGKPVPIQGRDNATVTVRKLNSHTTVQSWNFNGRTAKSKAVLSKDGKTTTFTMDGTDKDGKPFHEMVVYDKE